MSVSYDHGGGHDIMPQTSTFSWDGTSNTAALTLKKCSDGSTFNLGFTRSGTAASTWTASYSEGTQQKTVTISGFTLTTAGTISATITRTGHSGEGYPPDADDVGSFTGTKNI